MERQRLRVRTWHLGRGESIMAEGWCSVTGWGPGSPIRLPYLRSFSQSIYCVSLRSEEKCESLQQGRQGKEVAGRTEFGEQLTHLFANTHCQPTNQTCPVKHSQSLSSLLPHPLAPNSQDNVAQPRSWGLCSLPECPRFSTRVSSYSYFRAPRDSRAAPQLLQFLFLP